MVVSVGKFTNSYKAAIGEVSDGYIYRIADDEIDDTCFSVAQTYYNLEDAQEALTDILEFASVLSAAIKDATNNKRERV